MITYRFLKKTLTFILAGGQGERLYPLTKDRSKPSVPFGGIYRIIDFPLSNAINSDLRKIIVLTQYKSLSLDRHIKTAWNLFTRELEGFVDVVPAQQRIDSNWYRGTADAIFQNIYSIEMEKPEYVLVLSGDHVYKMDYRKLIGFHIEKNADLTIAAIEVPR
ncbi:MAG TPA: sugar phosphate nucleotidyltransferase, partial [Spirochaetota bacterium]|nr:sugar phosphate nucleotidyltransferase [Spirochaetota bacterium]